MKKTFNLTHPKIKYPRLIEAAKNEAKKYLKRERNKALPKGADFWDFACKFGADAESAEAIHVTEINKKISFAESQQWQSFYLEIIAVAENRVFVEREDDEDDFEDPFEDDEDY